MSRGRRAGSGAALGAIAALALSCPSAPAPVRGPSVLLISIDSLRADHLGCYGYPRPTSPRIDALAAQGAVFADCFSSTSWTLPAHAALFTGLPDSAHGCDSNERVLAPRHETLAEALAERGYETFGIWSGPYLHPRFGLSQGFARWTSGMGFSAYDDGTGDEGRMSEARANMRSHQDVTGPRIVDAFAAFLEGRPRSAPPFLAFVHMWDVHYDYVPPAPWARPFVDAQYAGPIDGSARSVLAFGKERVPARDLEQLRGLYDGEIAWTDHHVGRMLDLLEAAGLTNDTIVVLVSDHGEEFFEHGRFGHRQQLFVESVHIPWIVRWPQRIPAGTRHDGTCSIIDVAPTILELCATDGLSAASGISRAAELSAGRPAASTTAISELVLLGKRGRRIAARTAERTVFVDAQRGVPTSAFDRRADPRERADLLGPGGESAPAMAEVAAGTHALLTSLRERFGEESTPAAPLSPELKAALRDLGYLGEDEP